MNLFLFTALISAYYARLLRGNRACVDDEETCYIDIVKGYDNVKAGIYDTVKARIAEMPQCNCTEPVLLKDRFGQYWLFKDYEMQYLDSKTVGWIAIKNM